MSNTQAWEICHAPHHAKKNAEYKLLGFNSADDTCPYIFYYTDAVCWSGFN